MTLICDMEGDGLLYDINNIWCIVACNANDPTWWNISVPVSWTHKINVDNFDFPKGSTVFLNTHEDSYYGYKINGIFKLLENNKIVFHNAFGFDIPAIQKLYPTFNPQDVEDTFILSSLFNPDKPGGHSIENYGEECGIKKPEHEDWSKFSPEMLHRCIEDVRICTYIWNQMEKERQSHNWEEAIQLEYDIGIENAKQTLNGVLFNKDRAIQLYYEIDNKINKIDNIVIPQIPKRCVPNEVVVGYRVIGYDKIYKRKADVLSQGYSEKYIEKVYGHVKKPFKKNGEYTANVSKFIGGI